MSTILEMLHKIYTCMQRNFRYIGRNVCVVKSRQVLFKAFQNISNMSAFSLLIDIHILSTGNVDTFVNTYVVTFIVRNEVHAVL